MMKWDRHRRGLILSCVGTLLAVAPAGAQVVVRTAAESGGRVEGIRPDGLLVELGIVAPTNGDTGLLYGVRVGMGTFPTRHLDLSLGLRRWSTDIDRSAFGSSTPGSFSDTSLDAVLSYPLMRFKGLRPYLGTGLAGHVVGADVPEDASLEDALGGFSVGALALAGVGTTRPGLGFRLEARRDFVADVGAWSYALGVGWWPKTRAADDRHVVRVGSSQRAAPVAVAPAADAPAQPAKGTVAGPALVTALNHLKAQNEALAADLAELREQVAAAEGTRAPVAAAAPDEPVADRSTQLFESLARVTARSGHAGSLRRDGDNGLLTLDQSLLFTVGKSELTTGAREELRRLAVVFLRFPEARVIVQGHTDATGATESNQVLSLRRAETVRAELLAIGIRPDSVAAVGFGETRPVAGNDTPAGRARNRRVDLQITMPSSSSN